MRTEAQFRAHDRMKTIVAIVLFILFIILLLVWKPAPAAPLATPIPENTPTATGPTLPPFPDSPVPLTYNPGTRTLQLPNELDVFLLEDDNTWAPIYPPLPAELAAAVENGSLVPVLEADGWVLTDGKGTILYTYDADAKEWKAVDAAAEAPSYPPLPPELQTLVDDGTLRPIDGPNGWILADAEGSAVYYYDGSSAAWKMVVTAVEPTPEPPAGETCATVPARLSIGMTAVVVSNLNFRSSPGIAYADANWLLTNPAGTRLEVVGGPECIPFGVGAYRWWQVRLDDGREGWSAEGSATGAGYFLEPAP